MNEHPSRDTRTHDDDADVIALVSHEVRASLTVIAGYLRLLDRPLDEESRARALAESLRAVDRIDALLDELRDASVLGDCFAPRESAEVSMASVAEDVAASFGHAALGRLSTAAGCPGWVLGDAERLRQALANVVLNAITHGEGAVAIGVSCEGDRVLTRIEDRGPGIPEDERERVFDRAVRLDGTARTGGSGLGLYITRSIAHAHGGSVRAEDAGGPGGTRIVIDLPAAGSRPGQI